MKDEAKKLGFFQQKESPKEYLRMQFGLPKTNSESEEKRPMVSETQLAVFAAAGRLQHRRSHPARRVGVYKVKENYHVA